MHPVDIHEIFFLPLPPKMQPERRHYVASGSTSNPHTNFRLPAAFEVKRMLSPASVSNFRALLSLSSRSSSCVGGLLRFHIFSNIRPAPEVAGPEPGRRPIPLISQRDSDQEAFADFGSTISVGQRQWQWPLEDSPGCLVQGVQSSLDCRQCREDKNCSNSENTKMDFNSFISSMRGKQQASPGPAQPEQVVAKVQANVNAQNACST